jgi:hypothetical protein
MLNDFIAMSSTLTGMRDLERGVAEQYLVRISKDKEGGKLDELLKVFREIQAAGGDADEAIRQRIMNDAALGPLAQQIIVLWYTSALHSQDEKGKHLFDFPDDPNQYFSGLVWAAIRAHPLGLSGGYFGHWKYPPEN